MTVPSLGAVLMSRNVVPCILCHIITVNHRSIRNTFVVCPMMRYERRPNHRSRCCTGAANRRIQDAQPLWLLVYQDPPDYWGKVIARLVIKQPTSYVLVADTLAELHAVPPPGLERMNRCACDAPELVEVGLAP